MAPISFARGAPAPECIDVDLVADCARVALERDGTAILSYGLGGGYGPLRELLGERHGVDPSRVFVTTGGLQGFVFYAAAQLQRRPGRVLVEGPTYDRPLKLLGWRGGEVVSLPLDDEGLDPDALAAELARPGDVSFLYTIPTFQNPSGRTLGTDRRRRLAELVAAHGLDVLEDDPYGQVRYEGVAPPSVLELEGGAHVAFTSSFSKTVAPGLRVGYVVVPESLRAAYEDQAVSTYISPPLLPQAAVHELFARGAFEPNLDRIRGLLRTRRDAMLDALATQMPDGVRWSEPEGGYFLWVDFAAGTDAGALLGRATEAGVTFVRGTDFFPGGESGAGSARLAFSFESPERIAEGVALLASAL
ncbi:MAG: PLP-dependent aminotransferase family protein [Thermoleophilia bacterium]|nr:PLP-dependent aminotransferase family protein [Thermoleophilia bacterium]